MQRLILIDAALRLLAIGQVMLIALVIGRGAAPRPIRLSTVALLLGIAAYLTIATPIFSTLRGPLWALVQLGAQAVPLLLWVFAHQLFERPMNKLVLTGGVITLFACWIGFGIVGDGNGAARVWIGTVQRVVSLVLIAHALLIAIRERGDDLIEKRRRVRVGFVIVVGVLAVMVLLLEMLFGFRRMGGSIALPQSLSILIATMAMAAALLQSDTDLLLDPDHLQPASTLSPTEHVLNGKLAAAMAEGMYREAGLTIGTLADRLGFPEHRLRALINQRLGYRNFSAFLNHHRIAEAQALLADPVYVALPILTIAMDLGYGSLAPFNRAFRDATGQTPTEYRRAAILPV